MKKEIKQNWVNKFQNEFTPLIDFGTRNEVIEFIDNLLEQREKEILEIIQKEIAKADKYEVVPLERIRIKLIQLYDKKTNSKN